MYFLHLINEKYKSFLHIIFINFIMLIYKHTTYLLTKANTNLLEH